MYYYWHFSSPLLFFHLTFTFYLYSIISQVYVYINNRSIFAYLYDHQKFLNSLISIHTSTYVLHCIKQGAYLLPRGH